MEAKNNNKNSMNVIENTENEVQVTEESRKAYGRPSINEEKGWKLDHVIPFNFYHNAYIKSRASIDELVNMVLQECNIKPDDTCSWAKDIRTIIKHSIENYDKLLEECEKAIIAKEEADRKRKQDEEIQEKQRIAREINERRKKLAAMPKGFFTVCLYATVNFSYKYYEYEGYAENGEEAYKMAVAKLKKDFGARLWDYDSILDAEIIPRLLGDDIYSL